MNLRDRFDFTWIDFLSILVMIFIFMLMTRLVSIARGQEPEPPPARMPQYTPAGAYAEARRTGQPLVVSVECNYRAVPGTIQCRWDEMPGLGDTGPAVVVGVLSLDRTGGFRRSAPLPATVTLEQVRGAIRDLQDQVRLLRGVPGSGPAGAPHAPPVLSHQHVCGACGHAWSHEDDRRWQDNVAAHTCPHCGVGPWWMVQGRTLQVGPGSVPAVARGFGPPPVSRPMFPGPLITGRAACPV